jgi:hypothetical protein
MKTAYSMYKNNLILFDAIKIAYLSLCIRAYHLSACSISCK